MPKKTHSKQKKRTTQKKNDFRTILHNQSNIMLLLAILIILTGSLILTGGQITGFATTLNGTTYVNVTSEVSIQLSDDNINFGTCVPGASGINVSSHNTTKPTECQSDGQYPDFMTVRNIGNQNISLTVGVATDNESFVGGTDSEFTYSGWNETASGTSGCNGTLMSNYTKVSAGWVSLCNDMDYVGTPAVNLSLQLFIPLDATVSNHTIDIIFVATPST